MHLVTPITPRAEGHATTETRDCSQARGYRYCDNRDGGGGGLARGKWVTRADAVSCSERCTATTSLCLSQTSLSRRPLDWPATTVSASACIRSGLQCVSSVDLYVHGVIGNSCWRLLTTPQPSWSMTQVMRPPVVNHRQTSQYTLKLNI